MDMDANVWDLHLILIELDELSYLIKVSVH